VEAAAAQPASDAASAAQAPARASTLLRISISGRLVPPARQEREKVSRRDGDQHHHDRDQNGVETTHAQRPQDDPEPKARSGGENQSHPLRS
jgi:hypothetical protein